MQYENATASLREANHLKNDLSASDTINESNGLKPGFSSLGQGNALISQQDCPNILQNMLVMEISSQKPCKIAFNYLRGKISKTAETG